MLAGVVPARSRRPGSWWAGQGWTPSCCVFRTDRVDRVRIRPDPSRSARHPAGGAPAPIEPKPVHASAARSRPKASAGCRGARAAPTRRPGFACRSEPRSPLLRPSASSCARVAAVVTCHLGATTLAQSGAVARETASLHPAEADDRRAGQTGSNRRAPTLRAALVSAPGATLASDRMVRLPLRVRDRPGAEESR